MVNAFLSIAWHAEDSSGLIAGTSSGRSASSLRENIIPAMVDSVSGSVVGTCSQQGVSW